MTSRKLLTVFALVDRARHGLERLRPGCDACSPGGRTHSSAGADRGPCAD